MKTINEIYGGVQEQRTEQKITDRNNPSETVENINGKLMAVFGMKEKIPAKLSKVKNLTLSDENEINSTEAQLAKMFGKYNDMMQLSEAV